MHSTSQLSTSYNMRSASKYLDERTQSAHWTVYSIARSKEELKVQLCINAMFYLSIFCITIGVGFLATGLLDLITMNAKLNYGVSLWGGALFAIGLGAALIVFRKKKNPTSHVASILLALCCIALVIHVLTVALSAAAVSNEYTSFEQKLRNACDPDPNSYYLGGQAGSSGPNYNPNNPNYNPNCSPNNTNCNVDPNQYATANPAYWWSTNKDTVFKVYQYYYQIFRFAYAGDVCTMVMAVQMIATEIALIVAFKYLSNHLEEFTEGTVEKYDPAPPQQADQKVMSYLNASRSTTSVVPPQTQVHSVPPVTAPAPAPAVQKAADKAVEPLGQDEQPIYANVHVKSNAAPGEPVYDNTKKPTGVHAEPQPAPAPAPAPITSTPAPAAVAADLNRSAAPTTASRSTLNTMSGSAAGLSLASRSSRPPRGAVQTRAMLVDEAPPQTLPLKRLNAPTTNSKANISAAAPVPVRVGASNSSRNSALPARHTMNKY